MLSIRNLTKTYGAPADQLKAVDTLSFDVQPGEFFTMLGPSGCGKTTTLRMVAGLESVTSGSILFEGRDYTRLPAQQRNIGMVFQSYALFPHLSVFENVAYGLRTRGLAATDIAARVAEILRALKLDAFAARKPAAMSGGQQQRVSLARALVYRPSMLLLDEPLANLDAKLRVQMREEIRRIQREFSILSLYVTHDQEEAMAISDRLALFNTGKLVQIGRPRDVYRLPANLFAADFIGHADLFKAKLLARDAAGAKAALPGGTTLAITRVVDLAGDEAARVPDGADGLVMARPEAVTIQAGGSGIPGRVRRIQQLGGCLRYNVETDAGVGLLTIDAWRATEEFGEGSSVSLGLNAADCVLYVRSGARA
jgi:iron(III) transport system ATP-binding protein